MVWDGGSIFIRPIARRGLRVELAFGERVHTETSCYAYIDERGREKVGDRLVKFGVSVRGWFIGERVAARRPAA